MKKGRMKRRKGGGFSALVSLAPAHPLEETFGKFPWLWGVTSAWFPNSDKVEVRSLNAADLKDMVYTQCTDLGGSSWFVYQELKDGTLEVEDVCRYRRHIKSGVPLASVIQRLPGVRFLVELRFVYPRGRLRGKSYRHFFLHRVPWGRRGSKLKGYCLRALKDTRAIRVAVRRHESAVKKIITEYAVQAASRKRRRKPVGGDGFDDPRPYPQAR